MRSPYFGLWYIVLLQAALLLYTDGVTDAKRDQRERLGEHGLVELLGQTPPERAREVIERLQRCLEGCAEWPDDMTALAIGWVPPTAGRAPAGAISSTHLAGCFERHKNRLAD